MATLVYPDLCPDCGNSLSRSRRRGWIEKLLARYFRIGIFRCHRCGARFYSRPALMVRALGGRNNPRFADEVSTTDELVPVPVPQPDSPPHMPS